MREILGFRIFAPRCMTSKHFTFRNDVKLLVRMLTHIVMKFECVPCSVWPSRNLCEKILSLFKVHCNNCAKETDKTWMPLMTRWVPNVEHSRQFCRDLRDKLNTIVSKVMRADIRWCEFNWNFVFFSLFAANTCSLNSTHLSLRPLNCNRNICESDLQRFAVMSSTENKKNMSLCSIEFAAHCLTECKIISQQSFDQDNCTLHFDQQWLQIPGTMVAKYTHYLDECANATNAYQKWMHVSVANNSESCHLQLANAGHT